MTTLVNYPKRRILHIDMDAFFAAVEEKRNPALKGKPVDVKDWQIIGKTLAEMTKEVVADMLDHGYTAKTNTVKIRLRDFQTLTRAKTIPDYSNSEEEIRKAAFACLKRIELNKRVRLICVRASNMENRANG